MATYVALNKTNMSADVAPSGLKIVEPPKKMIFKIEVTIDDKIFSKIQEDALLLDDMNKQAQKFYDQICASMKGKIKTFDTLFQKSFLDPRVDAAKSLSELNKALETDRSTAEKGGEIIVEQCWTEYLKRHKEYKKYKIKIAITIIGAVAGLVTSIALMASSPFTGGASAVLSIIGMFKSAATIIKEVGSAWMEIEDAQKMLAGQLAIVEKAAGNVVARKANEYSAAIIDSFLGISQPCIKTCISQLDTVEKKLIGIEVGCHEAAKTLNKILTEQEKLKSDFMKEAQTKLAKHPSPKAPAQAKDIEKRLDDHLAPNYGKVINQIETITLMLDRYKTAQKTTEELQDRIKPLAKLSTVDEKILRNVLSVVGIPLGAMSGNGIAKAATDLASGLGSAGGAFAYDKITGYVLDGSVLAS